MSLPARNDVGSSQDHKTPDAPMFVIKNQATPHADYDITEDEAFEPTKAAKIALQTIHDGKRGFSPRLSSESPSSSAGSTEAISRKIRTNLAKNPAVGFSSFVNLPIPERAATTGNHTPQVVDLGPESSFESPASSDGSPSSYYIFDPNSPTTAFFVQPHEENKPDMRDSKYAFEKVPLELTLYKGKPVFVVHVSDMDQESTKNARNDNLRAIFVSSNGVANRSSQTDDVQIRDSGDTCIPSSSSFKVTYDLIAKSMERLLVHNRLGNQIHAIDHFCKHFRGSKDLYLVNDEDIHRIVDAVLDTMDNRDRSDESTSCGFPTTTQSLPKLDDSSNAFLPPSPTVADPATTISMPMTSYASLNPENMQICTKVRSSSATTVATIVSRKSVAEITFTQRHSSHQIEDHARRLTSGPSFSLGSLSFNPWSNPPRAQPEISYAGLIQHDYDADLDIAELIADINHSQSVKQEQNLNQDSKITRFPKLRPRKSTKDWLNPLAKIEPPKKQLASSLYHSGVDAHGGDAAQVPIVYVEEHVETPPCDHSLFNGNPFCLEPENHFQMRPAATSAESKGLRESAFTISYRRLSSHLEALPSETHDSFLPNILDKLRQRGHKVFHRHHHSPKGSENLSGGAPVNSPMSEPQHESGLSSPDMAIGHSIPELSRADKAGIHEAMAGTGLTVDRRMSTCSEDSRPHQCADELRTETPSPVEQDVNALHGL